MKPLCLSIGGLDPTGGAGILLDINVFRDFGVDSCVLTSVLTEQTTDMVFSISKVGVGYFSSTLNTLLKQYKFNAVKVSVIRPELIEVLLSNPLFMEIPIKVIDPVLASSSGYKFINVKQIMPLIQAFTLVTPNTIEFLSLLNIRLGVTYSSEELSQIFRNNFPGVMALVKGFCGDAKDLLIGDKEDCVIPVTPSKRKSEVVHGTGCLLSAGITAELSKGIPVNLAVLNAKTYLSKKLDEACILQFDSKFRFSF